MIQPPAGVGAFQFVILATLRAAQLIRGCRPKVGGMHKATILAQLEVSEGKVTQLFTQPQALTAPIGGAPIEVVPALVYRV